MSARNIRDAIAARLAGVDGIGAVHAYQRHAARDQELRDLYGREGRLLGWFVTRTAAAERADTNGYNRVVHRWRIEGVMSWSDTGESELAFDDLVEAAREAFRADGTLGGMVEAIAADGLSGLQLDIIGPAMFAGVLVHHARLSLATVCSAEIGVPAVDDFRRGDVDWDLATPDGAIDAEDTIHLETAA